MTTTTKPARPPAPAQLELRFNACQRPGDTRPITTAMSALSSYRGGLRGEDYDVSHPWYYLLGGQPIDAASMKARRPGEMKAVLREEKKVVPIQERLKRKRAELAEAIAHYRRISTGGPSIIQKEPWTAMECARLCWAGSIAAAYAHITWAKGELRALAQIAGYTVPPFPGE